MTLAGEMDEVVGMVVANAQSDVLVVSENGYGKRSKLEEYRITNRGAKGVKTLNITEKTGDLIAIADVSDQDDLMIMNRSGLTIRTAVSQIRVAGRATQGVRIINLHEGDAIASVMAVPGSEGDSDSDGQTTDDASHVAAPAAENVSEPSTESPAGESEANENNNQ